MSVPTLVICSLFWWWPFLVTWGHNSSWFRFAFSWCLMVFLFFTPDFTWTILSLHPSSTAIAGVITDLQIPVATSSGQFLAFALTWHIVIELPTASSLERLVYLFLRSYSFIVFLSQWYLLLSKLGWIFLIILYLHLWSVLRILSSKYRYQIDLDSSNRTYVSFLCWIVYTA